MAMEILGGNLPAGRPVAVFAGGKTHVFAIGTGGIMNHWTSPNGIDWQGPGELPPGRNINIVPSNPCAIALGNAVHVFAINKGGPLVRWSSPDGTNFMAPFEDGRAGTIPADTSGVTACSPQPNRIDAFAVTSSGLMRYSLDVPPTGPLPSTLTSGSLPPCVPAAVCAAANVTDVFAVRVDGNALRWRSTDGVTWVPSVLPPPPGTHPGPLVRSGFAAVSPAPGRIELFAITTASQVTHWSLDGANVTGVSFLPIPPEGIGEGVPVAIVVDGRIEVFAIGKPTDSFAGGPLLRWRRGRGNWSSAKVIGANLSAGGLAAAVTGDGRIDVFGLGGGGLQHWPAGIGAARNEPWVNWPSNHPTNPAGVLRPDSLEELVNIVQEAERLGRNVRAVGTGWSNSDVAVSAGYVVETDALSAVLTDVLSTSLNAAGAAMQLVHVEAGIKLDTLVDRVFASGFELMTLGGSTGQSLAGAVSTSTHGMDVDRGPLPDMVRAIHLVGPGGVQHWIEPSSRIITDRAALKGALGLTDENIHYDDDWFYSVLVSMGSMGIIYSLIIEVEARYALKQTRANIDWSDIRAWLAGGAGNPLADNTNRGVQVAFNPYPRGDGTLVWNGTRVCYLTTRKAAPEAGVQVPPADDTWLGDLLTPLLVAAFIADRGSIDDRINDVTSKKQEPNDITAWAHNLAGGRNTPSSKGLTVEFMFDASTTRYLDFVDAALEIISKAYHVESPNLAYIGWISMRFQGNSRAYLSPQHGAKRTCSIEFAAASLLRVGAADIPWPDTRILLDRIEAKGREFGGIQHWGLNNNLDASDVALAYPRLDTWRRVRWELTKGSTITTFDSDFTRRCGLSDPPVFVRPAAFGGDGRTSLAYWRPSSGVWVILDNAVAARVQQWGQVGDIPVPGDYDGDGKTDFAVWRPSTGTWFIIQSSQTPGGAPAAPAAPGLTIPPPAGLKIDTSDITAQRSQQWGQVGDIPVPGDYSSDGRTDFAVWRPSTGEWFIKDNVSGAERVQQWGTAGDIPVPGDYGGDGRTDFAVWRPSTGVWSIKDSSTGAERNILHGQFGYVPV
jgi:hypothetical protein